MKIVAIGRTEILYNTIERLIEAGHDVCAIVTCEGERHYLRHAFDFKKLAVEHGIKYYFSRDFALIREELSGMGADVAVSCNWPVLIPQEIIDIFPRGIINAHSGDLPRYRGNAVMNWAIINGEDKVVLTLHLMSADLDLGSVLLKRDIPIQLDTYISDLYKTRAIAFPWMFVAVIRILEKRLPGPELLESDKGQSMRCYPRTHDDAWIDWKQSSEQISRLVRASAEPFDGAYTKISGDPDHPLIIWRARSMKPGFEYCGTPGQVAERRGNRDVAVITGDGFLVLEDVEYYGRRGPACDIIKTIRIRLV